MTGFGQLSSVAGDIVVQDNPTLTQLAGLHGIAWVSGGLLIEDNACLTQAEADAVLDAIGRAQIGGLVNVTGSEGCTQ